MRAITIIAYVAWVAADAASVPLVATAASPRPARLQIVIDGGDGYGLDIAACAEVGFDCRRIVADSWCQANGRGRSVSIQDALSRSGEPRGRVSITCE